MAADRRYNEIVPEPIRRFEAEHFDQRSDWYIRSSANVGIYLEPLEDELPSTLLDSTEAEEVLKGRVGPLNPQAAEHGADNGDGEEDEGDG